MGQAIGYTILGEINKIFNRNDDEGRAVYLIEQYLGKLVTNGILTSWDRNKSGCGWIVYESETSDGIYMNWNDTGSPLKKPDEEPEDES